MRKPNHIILNFENSNTLNSSNYWAINHLISSSQSPEFMKNLNLHKKYCQYDRTTSPTTIFKTPKKFTIKPSRLHPTEFLNLWEKEGVTKVFKPNSTVSVKTSKHLLKYSQHVGRDAYMYINLPATQYYQRSIKCLLSKYVRVRGENINPSLVTWFNNTNVNFLRKERLYTKLKYSRSPAYDIVSGGAAALLAGFIGFLISEKFGYELVDSGDFYYLFMYIVFLSFSIRPLLVVSDSSKGFWHALSLNRVLSFYTSILQLILKNLK